MNNHAYIRIGTLVPMKSGAPYIRQILPYGFESFSLTFWEYLDELDYEIVAKEIGEAIGDRAVISCLTLFGNPLQNARTASDIARCIDLCERFNCRLFTGFAGAIEGKAVPASMSPFRRVWGELAKRAADRGVRIAFENCDMEGWWDAPRWNIAHAPAAWEMIFNELPYEHIGLEWEPAHQIHSLVDPLPQLRRWIRKVFHVHGKDGTLDWEALRSSGIRGGRPYVWHRTPGFGDTNWTDVISILRMGGYRGSIDIEGWHDPVYCDDLEMTGQVHGLNHLKHCRGGAYIPNPTRV